MRSGWQALQRGESVRQRRIELERAHELFVGAASAAHDSEAELQLRERFAASPTLRPLVLESWLRAQRGTIDPDHVLERPALDEETLEELRRTHPLAEVMPVLRRLLFDEAREAGLIVAVGDAGGRLLWVDGDAKLRTRAAEMGFRPGMDWSERSVGTSAPGSAITLGHPLQVLGAEHFSRAVHEWSCTAAPVHDPLTGAILGVVDVTGGDSAASPHLLPLLQATLAAIEAELQLARLRALLGAAPTRAREPEELHTPPVTTHETPEAPVVSAQRLVVPGGGVLLRVLGRDAAVLEWGGRTATLPGRHAEILVALATTPQGCSSPVLAEQIYGRRDAEQTLRSELARFRRWCGGEDVPIDLASRPYRVVGQLRIDALETLEALQRGAHKLALAGYVGPALHGSVAPAVERLRGEVDATLRETMLSLAAPDVLYEYAQRWAPHDEHVWHTLLRVLPPNSPKRARVVARLELLD